MQNIEQNVTLNVRLFHVHDICTKVLNDIESQDGNKVVYVYNFVLYVYPVYPHQATNPQKHETKDDVENAPQICKPETGSTCYAR